MKLISRLTPLIIFLSLLLSNCVVTPDPVEPTQSSSNSTAISAENVSQIKTSKQVERTLRPGVLGGIFF